MLWQIYVYPQPGQPDLESSRVADEIRELRIGPVGEIRSARGYLIEGNLQRQDVERLGRELLADPVTERFRINDSPLTTHSVAIANVLLKPGVMDPVAQSANRRRSSRLSNATRNWVSACS